MRIRIKVTPFLIQKKADKPIGVPVVHKHRQCQGNWQIVVYADITKESGETTRKEAHRKASL